MTKRLAMLLLVLLALPLFAQQSTNDEQAVRDARRALLEATKAKDRAALEKLLTDPFTFIHGRGNVENRKQFLDMQVSANAPHYTFDPQDEDLTILGDTAIVVVRAIAKTGESEQNIRASQVFVKRNGKWLWAFGQTTLLPSRPKAAAIDLKLLDDYAGNYAISAGRIISVVREKDTLVMHIANRKPGELIPRSDTEFVWFNPDVNTDSVFVFVRGENGKATEVQFRQDGRDGWRAKRID